MTNPTPHGQVPAIQRYKIGYHSDEWGVRSLSPTGIYDDAGPWVRYEDHAAQIAALRTQQPAPATQQAGEVVAYLDIGAGGYLDLGSALSDEDLQQLPKGRHALVIAGTYGIDGYVAAPPPTPPAEQQAPSAAAADTVVLEAALRAIHQAIDLIGEPDTERLRTVRRVLRGAVIVAEDAGEAATAPQPAPECHHRPPCAECASLTAQEHQP